MKTTPLSAVLKQITPLPYRVSSHDALKDVRHIDAGPAGYERTTAAILSGKASGPDAAYLTHAANVLPGLVEALAPFLMGTNYLTDADFDRARAALSDAINVTVNS